MPAKIDLSGHKFGKLLVLDQGEYVVSSGQKKITWRCLCDCGNVVEIAAERLRNGNTKSCGCARNEAISRKRRDDSIIGKVYGRLTVVARAGKDKSGHSMFECVCECGAKTVVARSNLTGGYTTSCGCARKDSVSAHKTTHGGTHTRLYRVWRGMMERCGYPDHVSYQYYGGRGISVCEDWKSNYESFREWALNNGYDEGAKFGECTLDRIDVDDDYCPENCRWVSMAVQNSNKRKS